MTDRARSGPVRPERATCGNDRSAEDAAEERALRAEWQLGADGLPHREAARVVAFDDAGRILLVLGHDGGDANRRWFFTPGGGIDVGETPREAAAREFREETGVAIAPERLIGPVLKRHAIFRFVDETRTQDEQFFVVHLTGSEAGDAASQKGAKLTLWERELLDGMHWWDPATPLGTETAEIYPAELGELARGWWRGWDGAALEIWDR